jgi:hypothetical protein
MRKGGTTHRFISATATTTKATTTAAGTTNKKEIQTVLQVESIINQLLTRKGNRSR